ncbi:MAG: helix-turn-helix domain-containing protein [Chloroflexota bacterium]|nr:helix-turn-helix domain-containing protein [Chloroflexota bacterium]
MSSRGLTIAGAAQALGVSERTIRRHIKSGKLKAELVSGRYGSEYRILDLSQAREGPSPQPAATAASTDRRASRMDTGGERVDSELASALDRAFDMIKALQQEKSELYAQLGYLQAQCRHLDDQVKLLTAARRPLWRRLLRH